MNRLKISIITVTYNAQNYIEDTIESVLNQGYENLEYIIIDGASTDFTLDIIRRYDKKIDCVVSEKDRGIYDAMNKGINIASGEVIGLINAGDLLCNGALMSVASYYDEVKKDNPFFIITGCMEKINEKGEVLFVARKNYDSLRRILKRMPVNHPSTFVSKEVYNKFGAFDINYKILADYQLMLRCNMSGMVTFYYVNDTLTQMLIGGYSERFTSIPRRAFEYYKVRRSYMFWGLNLLYSIRLFCVDMIKIPIRTLFSEKIKKYYATKK